MIDKIDILDHGYVRLANVMGDDLSIVNAARVSYDKESKEFDLKDARLLAFLAREKHTAPFRHASVTLEVYAPLFVARQWWKYAVASTHIDDLNGWNESSRRYITEEPVFYNPNGFEWRCKPENSKQGSGDPISPKFGGLLTLQLQDHILQSLELYNNAVNNHDVAPEQARLFLPAYGMYVRWRWTASLQTVVHFLQERVEHDAQWEIQQYAQAVRELVKPSFPESFEAFGL